MRAKIEKSRKIEAKNMRYRCKDVVRSNGVRNSIEIWE
jgi:hypothetical protein